MRLYNEGDFKNFKAEESTQYLIFTQGSENGLIRINRCESIKRLFY